MATRVADRKDIISSLPYLTTHLRRVTPKKNSRKESPKVKGPSASKLSPGSWGDSRGAAEFKTCSEARAEPEAVGEKDSVVLCNNRASNTSSFLEQVMVVVVVEQKQTQFRKSLRKVEARTGPATIVRWLACSKVFVRKVVDLATVSRETVQNDALCVCSALSPFSPPEGVLFAACNNAQLAWLVDEVTILIHVIDLTLLTSQADVGAFMCTTPTNASKW